MACQISLQCLLDNARVYAKCGALSTVNIIMLINEFMLMTKLPRDTVRFYVRQGLLRPHTSQMGGRHPYMQFTQADVDAAEAIRVGQALGMSLKEIGHLQDERRNGRLQRVQRVALMRAQLVKLEEKAMELANLQAYVRAKIEWQQNGEKGPVPRLNAIAATESVSPRSRSKERPRLVRSSGES